MAEPSRQHVDCACGHLYRAHIYTGQREPSSCNTPGCACRAYDKPRNGSESMTDGVQFIDTEHCTARMDPVTHRFAFGVPEPYTRCGRLAGHGGLCSIARREQDDLAPSAAPPQMTPPFHVACCACKGDVTVEFVRCSQCSKRAEDSLGGSVAPFTIDSVKLVIEHENVPPWPSHEIALIGHNLRELAKLSLDERIRVANYVMQYVQDTAMPVGRAPKKG